MKTRNAFTLLEILVATMLLAMLVTILTMIFNQSSIAWTTGVASVAGLRNVREQLATYSGESENLVRRDTGGGNPVRVVSVWGENGGLREDGRTLVSTFERLAPVTTDAQDPLQDRTITVGGGTASGRDSYIVGVTSWGPDRSEGTWDDITTMPEEVVK